LVNLNKILEQKKIDLIKELDGISNDEFSLEPDKKISEFIGDIFYNSMKNLFDTGAKLAKSLTGELFPENRD
ncbi:MAG: hypothetical protein ACTSQW_10475, partial [Promethearchaeota archaeon]